MQFGVALMAPLKNPEILETCSIISAAHWIGLGFLPVNSAAFAADAAARSR